MAGVEQVLRKLIAREGIGQFVRFSLVGVANTAVFYAVYLAVLWAGMSFVLAATAGAGVGIVNSYVLNKIFTFRSGGGVPGRSLGEKVRFVAVYVVQYFVNIAVISLCVNVFGIPPEFAGLPGIGIAVLVSYFGHKYWTFR
ncbi:MAG: GtrA family protein [Defluviitaleaceae bacterium]|nr:GtrA family protein [Defluviitaleaceae bacterium]